MRRPPAAHVESIVAIGFAALSNAISRRALSLSVERVVFGAGGDPGPFAPWRDLPIDLADGLTLYSVFHQVASEAARGG